jgi:hypothetical protein
MNNSFCKNCGTPLQPGYQACPSCGTPVTAMPQPMPMNNQPMGGPQMPMGQPMGPQPYYQAPPKQKYSGYFAASSIIMIIIGAILIVGSGSQTAFDDVTMALVLPGICGVVGGILCLVGKKNKVMVMASGGVYILATILNSIAISDVSLYGIAGVVFGILNIVFGLKINQQ